MADGVLTRTPVRERRERRLLPKPLSVRWRLLPWWSCVILVYAASRVVSSTLLLILASVQKANPWTGAHPSYLDFANMWDGRWYNIIALTGYPSSLPLTDGVHVGENAWAFMPGYPFLVRGLMTATGLPWTSLAVFASLAFGLGSALVFYKLLVDRLGPSTSLFAVALFCLAPVSPLFQLAYAESMQIFFLALALLLLLRRRYWLLVPVVAIMALTRPTGLAFALTLGLHAAYRFFTRQRDPFPMRERVAAASVAVFSAIMGVAWLLIAWAATGDFSAYTDTELAWRMPYIGYVDLIPFTPWFQSGAWWLGAPAGYLAAAAVIVAFTGILFTPAVRRIGIDLRFWLASYGLYLLAVFFPQSSTFRLLMPLFPLLGVLAEPRSRIYRATLIVVFIAAQWGWLLLCWGIDGADWTPP